MIASKVNTVSKWVSNNLKNIHLWIASLPLWDQLVADQTCYFHRVYDDSFLPLDILSLQYLVWLLLVIKRCNFALPWQQVIKHKMSKKMKTIVIQKVKDYSQILHKFRFFLSFWSNIVHMPYFDFSLHVALYAQRE